MGEASGSVTESMTREVGQVVVPQVSRTIEPACRYQHFWGGEYG
jgi:hypothetical protein